jgi:hypothetical protein
VVARTPFQAVVVIGSPPNHVLHAILTIFLCGLWAPVWLLIAATTTQRRVELSVDEFGQISDGGRRGFDWSPFIAVGIFLAVAAVLVLLLAH